jgi:hypothetical protein
VHSSRTPSASIASRAQLRDDREAPLIGRGTRGKVLLICPTSQAKLPATQWHDGQISSRERNAVKDDLLVSRTRCGMK